MTIPRLMTVYEVAEVLRVKPETVRMLARRGDIESIRVGRGSRAAYRFTEKDVIAYLQKQRTGG